MPSYLHELLSFQLIEVSSIEWEFAKMSEQEEDMIYRMYKLVGDRYLPIIEGVLRLVL